MKLFFKYLGLLFMLIFPVACFEEDERVLPYPGEVITIYEDIEIYQSYFDFETGRVVCSHVADSWHLGFECGDEGWHILVNSGANWFLWNSQQTDIDAVLTYPENDLWAYDNQSAYPDSTAVGNWVNFQGENRIYTNEIYLLGRYSSGNYSDLVRLRFIEVESSYYRFIYKDESAEDTVTVHKSDTANFVYYSFQTQSQIDIEPDKLKFDLMFGPYYDLATQFGITIPYLVRGVLLNTGYTTAILDSIRSYNEIDYETLDSYRLSAERDIIGYQWKDVSVNTSAGVATYTVKPNYTYIIRTSDDKYYKLRFLSFSIDGISGHPRFEYKELKPVI